MKKKFIFCFSVAFLFLFFSKLNAQEFSYQFFAGGSMNYQTYKYDFGIRGIDTSYTSEMRYSANFGVGAEYMFPKYFAIKLEAQYSKRSGRIISSKVGTVTGFTAVQRTYTSSYDYLQLNLLPQLNLPVITKSHVFINAGPYLSFMFAAQETIDEESLLQSRSYSKDISFNTKSVDAGLVFGLGIEYTEARYVGYTAGIRYALGLKNILDTPDNDKISIRNNSLSLNVGIILK